jgi:hypothetical protein
MQASAVASPALLQGQAATKAFAPLSQRAAGRVRSSRTGGSLYHNALGWRRPRAPEHAATADVTARCAALPLAVRSQAVQAPAKADVSNVSDVALKDVPLRSLFPDVPTIRPVRI